MIWVATEDVGTAEVTAFDAADETDVIWLMDAYRVDVTHTEQIRVRDMEDGQHVVYDGVIYRGGFGCNLWVTRKYREL